MGLQSISTFEDPNSHGEGLLQSSQIKVYINSLPVVLFGDIASPDTKCHPKDHPIHCSPIAIEGSLKVFIQNRQVHRRSDKRACGAVTVPSPGSIQKVFAG